MLQSHTMLMTRLLGGSVDLSVYLTLLEARQGIVPFVRFERLKGALNLPNGTLEEALERLTGKGWIERARPSGCKVFYYAAL